MRKKTRAHVLLGLLMLGLVAVSSYAYAEADTGEVIVFYKESLRGTDLTAPITLKGGVGRPYSTQAKTFEGYTLYATPPNPRGMFMRQTQYVMYVYNKNWPNPPRPNPSRPNPPTGDDAMNPALVFFTAGLAFVRRKPPPLA